jgi:predicted double-glycine peptidase
MKRAAIVAVRVKGFNHFVVFRGLLQDRVFLADPAFGNLMVPKERFLSIWKNGLAFFVYRRGTKATEAQLSFAGGALIPDGGAVYRATVGQAIFQPARPLH